jgi:hypothetical protein
VNECKAAESAFERGREVLFAEIAFKASSLFTVGVEDEDGWGPYGFEAVEPCRVFLDMGFDGNEVLMDELCNFRIGVGLGFQPSASPSSRRCAEIEKDWAVLLFGFIQSLVDVFAPVHGHDLLQQFFNDVMPSPAIGLRSIHF